MRQRLNLRNPSTADGGARAHFIASVNHMRYSSGLCIIVYTVALFTIAAIVTPVIAIAQTKNRNTARTSVFDQQWLNTVVSIETIRGEKDPHPVGTGFLIQTQRGLAVLVTVKHVVLDAEQQLRDGLVYRLNDTQSHSRLVTDAELQDRGLGGWFWSSTDDLACRFIVWSNTAEVAVIPLDKFLSWKEIQAGAPLLVLGFPLGLRSVEHANPVVRSGVVARSDAQGLLADVSVFAGNSGGPVLYVPPIKVHESLRSPFINEERLVETWSQIVSC